MNGKSKALARIDFRLTQEKKSYFERVAHLGGYGNMSAFIITTLQEKADQIIKEKERILASEKDAKIFFDAITNPPLPNEALKDARDNYLSMRIWTDSDEN